VTDFVPDVPTVPTLLSIVNDVAFVDVQVRVELPPLVMFVGLAVSVTVGWLVLVPTVIVALDVALVVPSVPVAVAV